MPENTALLHLGDDLLAGLGITTADVVESIEAAFREARAGRLWAAPKSAVLPGDGRYMMVTLAASDGTGVMAVKSVMVSPGNAARGLPGINGAILILDAETGLLKAVMGANWVTAVRTAGLSAVAAKRLADPGASVIAFVGCGVQARSHLDAFAAMFPLREVRAFGRGPANVGRICDLAKARGLKAVAPASPRDALEGVDIVVSSITLDYSVEPYLDARWLKPGAFATVTDLAIPWESAGMASFGRIYVDDLEQEAAAERRMVAPELITGDLSALVCDEPQAAYDPGTASAFVFRGMALGDLAVAALAYRRATGG